MYCTISANKTLGSKHFVDYLEKEDKEAIETIKNDKSMSDKFANYLDKENEISGDKDLFFNENSYQIEKHDVVNLIDGNRKGLKLNESNFFSLTFNPSKDEIAHINKIATKEAKNLVDIGVGNLDENKEWITRDLLKKYTEKCMDDYAKNFGRENIESGKDLVWFGKVERDRYWKWKDREVQHNRVILKQINKAERLGKIDEVNELKGKLILESHVRNGGKDMPICEMMPKNGDNFHVHVIVSRRDKEQKMSLSPLAKAKSNNEHQINGKSCKIGFDRDNFTNNVELTFDKTFQYDRLFYESYLGLKTAKLSPEMYKEREKEFYIARDRWLGNLNKDYAEKDINGRSIKTNSNGDGRDKIEYKEQDKIKQTGGRAINMIAQKSGLDCIQNELNPYKKFMHYGNGVVNILKLKDSTLQRQQLAKLMAKASMDYMNIAALGALPTAPLQMVLGGVGALKNMVTGKESDGMER